MQVAVTYRGDGGACLERETGRALREFATAQENALGGSDLSVKGECIGAALVRPAPVLVELH